jgi:hypothetical protein
LPEGVVAVVGEKRARVVHGRQSEWNTFETLVLKRNMVDIRAALKRLSKKPSQAFKTIKVDVNMPSDWYVCIVHVGTCWWYSLWNFRCVTFVV